MADMFPVFPPLTASDIEVKIKQVTAKGAVALLYKTARTDMALLDQVCGPLGWQCDYTEIKGNLYCEISVWSEAQKAWVRKSDCGIESREDGEGNEKKGEASDAFKRAGFRWGIGRELYTAPFTFLPLETKPNGKNGFELVDRFARFEVGEIGYDENRHINRLTIVNEKTKEPVFTMGQAKKQDKPIMCSVCKMAITDADGKTAAQIAAGTKKHTGFPMCVPCFKKHAAAEKAAMEASGGST